MGVSEQTAEPISRIVNKSIYAAVYPKQFKVSVIKPLHMSGNKLDVSNYLRILIISSTAKIFVMKVRICSFIKIYKIM